MTAEVPAADGSTRSRRRTGRHGSRRPGEWSTRQDGTGSQRSQQFRSRLGRRTIVVVDVEHHPAPLACPLRGEADDAVAVREIPRQLLARHVSRVSPQTASAHSLVARIAGRDDAEHQLRRSQEIDIVRRSRLRKDRRHGRHRGARSGGESRRRRPALLLFARLRSASAVGLRAERTRTTRGSVAREAACPVAEPSRRVVRGVAVRVGTRSRATDPGGRTATRANLPATDAVRSRRVHGRRSSAECGRETRR